MTTNLKSWIVQFYRNIRKNRLAQRIRNVNHHIMENISINYETQRMINNIINQNDETKNEINEIKIISFQNIELSDEIRKKTEKTICEFEEIVNIIKYYKDVVEENRNRGKDTIDKDTIDIVEQIRTQNDLHDRRLRQVELYLLHLMKKTGVSLETLSAEASDSQQPAIASDIRFLKLELTKSSVITSINHIRALTELQCRDIEYLEYTLIPALGLAEENWSFPPEIAHLSGKGLHLLQLPCQLAPLLVWLADNASGIKNYMEIGVRWGGMFILISEWLRRFSPELRQVVALDPAEMSPLIREYIDFTSKLDGNDRLEVRYEREYSTSAAAKNLILNLKPDFVFIDGDHLYEGVSHDYELVRGQAKMIMFHDICASTWPGVGRLWQEVLEQNSSTHAAIEFTKQYQSGDGGGMGIGVIKINI